MSCVVNFQWNYINVLKFPSYGLNEQQAMKHNCFHYGTIDLLLVINESINNNNCANWRPICLSPVAYTLYPSILKGRLRPLVEPLIGNEQAGFGPGKQTQDNIFTVRKILKKTSDHGRTVYHAFLDLKAAFDSGPRKDKWEALNAKRVPQKLSTN